MEEKILIHFDRGDSSPLEQHEITLGATLLSLVEQLGVGGSKNIIAAYVNNRVKELDYRLFKSATLRYVDISTFAGVRVYMRSASLLLQCAVEEVLPDYTLYIRHSMGANGLYCEVEGEDGLVVLNAAQVALIEQRMRLIVEADEPIECQKLPTDEVRELYRQRGYDDKVALLDTRPRLYSEIYRLRNSIGYFYGSLAPRTSYVSHFELECYHKGFYMGLPRRDDVTQLSRSPEQRQMYQIFQLHQFWVDIMGVQTVGALNAKVLSGGSSEMIKLAEALSERGVASTADEIAAAYFDRGCRVVLLAGPSSSGKTTTSKRLGIQLQLLGLQPVLISMDDYFVDRECTPRDASGEYDFEALEAVDVARFNSDLNRLMAGESLCTPRYDFVTGRSLMHDEPLQLGERSIIIVEGIHGLNPKLSCQIDQQKIFRIYASCFTVVAMDNASRIASADNRLLRRLIRDYATRGASAEATLKRWASVRRGEERHIFPYQENADRMINTSLFYEIAVLRPYAERILREVPNTGVEFEEARRLMKLLDHFVVIDSVEIPPTSTLREFIGGGSFTY
ncbi:MAG: nucleoside kinase [Rikenellaceae bacterium]